MSGPNYDDYGDYDDYDANAEECFDWQFQYLSQGRSRAVLIAWLTARPQDANLIVHDILKFLPTERKYLEKDPIRLTLENFFYRKSSIAIQ